MSSHQLERTRKPRVHIKYEVETETGTVQKELPFVVGVMGDFTGNAPLDKKPLRERKFTTIDRDNFNEVMSRLKPGLSLRVNNVLTDENTQMQVDLQFNKMSDFEPAQIVNQVPALKELLDIRSKLCDLLTKSDRSEELEIFLEKILQDKNLLRCLAHELNVHQEGDK